MSDVAWEDYVEVLRTAEKLVADAETLIDGAGDEKNSEWWGRGREVWASDFEALKIQVEATRAVLRDAPTKPIKKGPVTWVKTLLQKRKSC